MFLSVKGKIGNQQYRYCKADNLKESRTKFCSCLYYCESNDTEDKSKGQF